MKKILTFLVLSSFVITTFAQDENNLKNFRFGLKVGTGLDWMRPDGKTIESNGSKLNFNYGLITEFRLSKIISLSLGIEGTYAGGSLNFKDSALYFVSDGNMIKPGDVANHTKTSSYQLKTRDYNVAYLTIPVALKMKTSAIGAMTYFGLFGGDLSIRAKATANDQLTNINVVTGTNFDQTNIDITSDVSLFRINLNVGGGFEYNLSGSTSLLVGINYRRSFTSVPSSESDYLQLGGITPSKTVVTNGPKFKQPAYIDGIGITVGILF